jgi:hypothetical protein
MIGSLGEAPVMSCWCGHNLLFFGNGYFLDSGFQSKKNNLRTETNKSLTLYTQQIIGVPLAIQSSGKMYI